MLSTQLPYLSILQGTGLAVLVIRFSNGDLVSEWSGLRQPGAILALTSTLANSLLNIAYVNGWVSFFWIQAIKGRIPLADIHHYWEGSMTVVGAFKSLSGKSSSH